MLNLIIEPMCLHCKEKSQEKYGLCKDCISELFEIESKNRCNICSHPIVGEGNICERCFKAKDSFDSCFSLFQYENSGRTFIHNLKFKDKLHFLKILEIEREKIKYILNSVDCITYIPSSYLTFAKRGFNLSYEIAKKLQKIHNVKLQKMFKSNFIYKKRLAISKNKSERKKIVNKFLKLRNNLGQYKTVLIVDDVFTTGTTLNKAASLLKSSKTAEFCNVFTLARVLEK